MAEKAKEYTTKYADPQLPLRDRIENLYDHIDATTMSKVAAEDTIEERREAAIADHFDDYMAAKNSDQRNALLMAFLEEDEDYCQAKEDLKESNASLKLLGIYERRLQLLVRAAMAPGERW